MFNNHVMVIIYYQEQQQQPTVTIGLFLWPSLVLVLRSLCSHDLIKQYIACKLIIQYFVIVCSVYVIITE